MAFVPSAFTSYTPLLRGDGVKGQYVSKIRKKKIYEKSYRFGYLAINNAIRVWECKFIIRRLCDVHVQGVTVSFHCPVSRQVTVLAVFPSAMNRLLLHVTVTRDP